MSRPLQQAAIGMLMRDKPEIGLYMDLLHAIAPVIKKHIRLNNLHPVQSRRMERTPTFVALEAFLNAAANQLPEVWLSLEGQYRLKRPRGPIGLEETWDKVDLSWVLTPRVIQRYIRRGIPPGDLPCSKHSASTKRPSRHK